MTVPAFLDAFVDDAALFPPASTPVAEAVGLHRAQQASGYAALMGGFQVRDTQVTDLADAVSGRSEPPLAINLVVTGGAGAIEPAVTWVSRSEGLQLRTIEFALRDEEDLAHNAGRLIRVVDSLDQALDRALDDVMVVAEPPMLRGSPSHGWLSALDELAAREIWLKFRTGGPTEDQFPSAAHLATCIEAALDREAPFTCTAGLHRAIRHRDQETGLEHHGFLNILVATRASLDGAGPDEVAHILEQTDGASVAARLSAEPALAARTRRWFRSVGSVSVLDAQEQLVTLGLLEPTPAGQVQ